MKKNINELLEKIKDDLYEIKRNNTKKTLKDFCTFDRTNFSL